MRVAALMSALAFGSALTGCAAHVPASMQPAPVLALGETDPVGTSNADAADDPAIWRNASNPADSLIVATDKRAGLHVYGLDGRSRHFDPSGRLNNVDLVDMGDKGVIVVASDRNDPDNAQLRLYRLDTVQARLLPLGLVQGGDGQAYGICLHKSGEDLLAYSVMKDGSIAEFRIELGDSPHSTPPYSTPLRSMKLASQAEGCAVDPRNGTLYVGEEDVGIWRFAAGSTQGEMVALVDGQQLVADVEGLALMPVGSDGGWLVASSQGDNTYALFSLPGMKLEGRFRIAAGAFGSTEETDGIELAGGSFGAQYPSGLFVAQDGQNAPNAQNFKLVSWADVLAAIAEQAKQ